MAKRLYASLSLIILLVLIITGCKYCTNNDDPDAQDSLLVNDNKANLFKINDRLFSIPSPVQVSMLIKEKNIGFNKDLLNRTTKQTNYTTTYKQAINLGVYGANLAYLNIYEQFSDAGIYFSVAKSLAKELGITSFFDEPTISRIESNQNNRDSLLFITSNMFRDADGFLVNNERNEVAVMILAGGWIESIYLLTHVASLKDPEIQARIGEQKHPLDNLIEIMRPYYGNQSNEYDKLLESLVELATIFDGITMEYEFIQPEVDIQKRTTTIKSKTKIAINEYQLKTITEKITTLRNSMIE